MTLLERVGPWAQVVVSMLVIITFTSVIGALVYTLFFPTSGDIQSNVRDVLLVLVGVLASSYKDIVGFWVGSSYGSATKTDKLAKPAP